ncbi:MAG: alpha,alpha-trehalase TreF [Paludibacter sp.]|nr:alpha,alpha-trehalase TreF [Paludibacter sp.]
MKKYSLIFLFPLVLLLSCIKYTKKTETFITGSPEALYGQLFYDVQSDKNIFSDSKYFMDAIPLQSTETIKKEYTALQPKNSATIKHFIEEHFKLPENQNNYIADSGSVEQHISALWKVLQHSPDKKQSGTLIPLPYSYVVPGGRFREIYYWDSYFTMLGLAADNENEIISDMIHNFSYLIDEYGFIPNGNRTYYLSRSQPPFYTSMIKILAGIKGNLVYSEYLPYMEKEYAFWMNGLDKIDQNHPAYERVVRLPNGEIMNRYWDSRNSPRPESYREDMATATLAAEKVPGREENIYRNIRAAAESGWDFSSRWLTFNKEKVSALYTIHTTDIIPVDLNALLCDMELTLSKAYRLSGNKEEAELYQRKCEKRKQAISKYCFDRKKGFFFDFNFKSGKTTDIFSLAGMYPLFLNIADKTQAQAVAQKIENSFLKLGGVVTTLYHTGEQWDAPNGWAPLQWISIKGLRNYGYNVLADTIKTRWLKLNSDVYYRTYKMSEKYDVENIQGKGSGGEYPNQDGFGWTNGVFLKLSKEK